MKEIKELLIEHRCADIGFENRGEEIEAKILSRFSELSETVKELEEGNRSLFQEKGLIKIDNDFNKTYLESAELLIAVLEKKVKELEAENKELQEVLGWLESIILPDDNYCEIYLGGLRNFREGHATAFQIESQPERFKTTQGKTLLEAINNAKNNR